MSKAIKLWVKFQSDAIKFVCNENDDVDDLIRKIKQDFSPRFDSVPMDSLLLTSNQDQKFARDKLLKDLATGDKPESALEISYSLNDPKKELGVSITEINDLIVLDRMVDLHHSKDSSVMDIVTQIITVIKKNPKTFVIKDKWETSLLLPKLGDNAQNYISMCIPTPDAINTHKDDGIYLSNFCLDKFTPLAPYFYNIPLDNAKIHNEERLIDLLPKKLQPLGREFLWIYLKEFLKERSTAAVVTNQYSSVISPGNVPIWDFSDGKITSSRFKFQKEKSISILSESITDSFDKVESLQLSYCNLFDEDMKYVKLIVEKLSNCKIVDLSWNRFHGLLEPFKTEIDTNLRDLLTKHTVVIVGNALATTDRVDFFENLDKDKLANLIWINEIHLNSNGWKKLINDEAKQSIVQEAHQNYYQT